MNTIHQLCSLRDPQATSGAASFAASQEVHVQVIYDRLSKLLSVLVTIDGIILGHDSLRGKVLTILGYWAVHKLRNAAGHNVLLNFRNYASSAKSILSCTLMS